MSDTIGNEIALKEEIVVLEHMTPSQMGEVMVQVAKVVNKLVGLALVGGGFGPAGAANQIAQSMIQAAIHSSASGMMLMEAARQVMGVGLVPAQNPPRRMN